MTDRRQIRVYTIPFKYSRYGHIKCYPGLISMNKPQGYSSVTSCINSTHIQTWYFRGKFVIYSSLLAVMKVEQPTTAVWIRFHASLRPNSVIKRRQCPENLRVPLQGSSRKGESKLEVSQVGMTSQWTIGYSCHAPGAEEIRQMEKWLSM
jgi:hypothetical protein